MLKKAWYHSKRVTLKKLLVFHHDPDREHWLLFSADLATKEIICYEPLETHGEAIEVQDIIILAKFFKPRRQAEKVHSPSYRADSYFSLFLNAAAIQQGQLRVQGPVARCTA